MSDLAQVEIHIPTMSSPLRLGEAPQGDRHGICGADTDSMAGNPEEWIQPTDLPSASLSFSIWSMRAIIMSSSWG